MRERGRREELEILPSKNPIPRPMKYVSKDSILNIPFIGWPIKLAGHIALKTDSRCSQLETFKNTVACLKDGNTVITFPEGTRSANGRLCSFKRGPFKMAIKSSTPIVPVTIYNLARWYPKGSLLPVDVPRGVKIVIHPPIATTDADVSADELAARVFEIVNSALPSHQQADADMPAVHDYRRRRHPPRRRRERRGGEDAGRPPSAPGASRAPVDSQGV